MSYFASTINALQQLLVDRAGLLVATFVSTLVVTVSVRQQWNVWFFSCGKPALRGSSFCNLASGH